MWRSLRSGVARKRRRRTGTRGARRLRGEPLENRDLMAVVFELGSLQATDGVVLNSLPPQDQAGWSVSDAGDVNADGFDDFLIGAPVELNFPAGTGQAYLLYGGSGLPSSLNLWSLTATSGHSFFGIAAEDHAGFSVSSAGDVNGDGKHDFIIGSPFADRFAPGGLIPGTGEAFVVFGGFSSPPSLAVLDGTNGFRLQGNGVLDRAGYSVSSAGDVNGDGYDDVLVGAPVDFDFPGVGQAYLLYGRAGGFEPRIQLGTLQSSAGAIFTGLDFDGHTGLAVSGLGDLNGDGFQDFAIGAPYGDRNAGGGTIFGSGETYVVFGGFEKAPTLSGLNGKNGFRVDGMDAFDRSGFSVSDAGDVNGDGFDDLLIGAPSDLSIETHAGKSFVVFGRATGFSSTLNVSSLNGSNGFEIIGIDGTVELADGTDHAGYSVSAAGDVNGDGLDDLIIGAPFVDKVVAGVTRSGVGESYILLGRTTAFPADLRLSQLANDQGIVLRGDRAFDRAGFSVSAAGDVNGDGFDDVLIGAPVDLDFDARPGRAYLVYGRDFTGLKPQRGDAQSNVLEGTAGADTLMGAQGADTLVGKGGADTLLGGEGNDVIAIEGLGFRRIDGGRGHDVLRLDGTGLTLKLKDIPDNRLQGIEEIDLSGEGDHRLEIGNVREVLNLSDTSNRLIVRRDAGDTIDLGANWTSEPVQTIDGVAFRVFRQGAAQVWITNLPPVVDLNGLNDSGTGFATTYREDAPPVVIVDADVVVIDDDQITSATVKVTNPLDGSAETLSVMPGSGITATYDSSTSTLSLSGSSSAAGYAQVLRSLKYVNTSQRPSTEDRLVEVVADDGLLASEVVTATVSVQSVNDAPVLDTLPAAALTSIAEDTLDPSGDTVASVVVDGSITDPDGPAVEAMAVVGVDNSQGVWQYSIGGGTWTDFGATTASSARLLDATDRIRFVPNTNFHGQVTLRYKAWDRTAGVAGEAVDAAISGGATPFSLATETATLRVTPVNDAPQLNTVFQPKLTSIPRGNINSPGDRVSLILPTGAIGDVDGPAVKAIAVVGVDDANGHWQHSADGSNWLTITATEEAALLLGPDQRIRFVPDSGFFGIATFSFRAWDRSSGLELERRDSTVNGGTTAFSVATDTARIEVLEEDSPPTIDRIASPVILPHGSGEHVLTVSGISDGGDATEPLTVTAVSSATDVIATSDVTYTSPNATASIRLTPAVDASGWSVITVTVTEVDGDSIVRQFAVSVGNHLRLWQNPILPLDVDHDGFVVPTDVLLVINELNAPKLSQAGGRLPVPPPPDSPAPFLDPSGDGFATPIDALQIINFLNRDNVAVAEGEALSGSPVTPASVPLPRVAPRAALSARPVEVELIEPARLETRLPHHSSAGTNRDRVFADFEPDEAETDLEAAIDELLGAR